MVEAVRSNRVTFDNTKADKACMYGNADPCTTVGDIRYYICDEHLEEKILIPLIHKIEQALYHVPKEIMDHGTASGIPYYYTQGVGVGREEAIAIIRDLKA
jgi:hypothetical protein